MKLLLATANRHKVGEFRDMLGGDRFTWSDLSEHTDVPPPDETGHTFRANACLKASYYARRLGTWALADDSGLAVDALGGKPGVHSARWAEMHEAGKGDAENNALLLRQVDAVPDERRTARFVCVLALADPDGRILLTAEGAVEGRLLRAALGGNGFGYDPLFLVPALGKTTAELSSEQKHRISHRGQALRRLREMMDRVIVAG